MSNDLIERTKEYKGRKKMKECLLKLYHLAKKNYHLAMTPQE